MNTHQPTIPHTIRQAIFGTAASILALASFGALFADDGVKHADSKPTPTMQDARYQVLSPEGKAFLNCRFLLPADFEMADIPAEALDFENPKAFLPLGVAMSPYGPMVISIAARPAYGDGLVSLWLDYLCREEGYERGEIEPLDIGSQKAVVCEALQQGDGILMQMRLALFENGGRMYQISVMAPQPLWEAVKAKLEMALTSLELEVDQGQQTPRFEGEDMTATVAGIEEEVVESAAAEEPETTPDASASEQTAALNAAEWAELVLPKGAASLDPEDSLNANLRNGGRGFTPNVAELNEEAGYAIVAAGAIERFLKVPLGWHVMDDGRRVLVFDADGRMQINLDLRRTEGLDLGAFTEACFQPLIEQQPNVEVKRFALDGIECALVLDADFDGETLCQAIMARATERDGIALVARATASSADMRLAMNLAGDLLFHARAPAAQEQ